MLRAFFIKVLLSLFAYIPLPLLHKLSPYLSKILQHSHLRAIKTCKQNIALCYAEKTPEVQQQLIQQSLQHSLMTLLELGHIWLRKHEYSLSLIKSIENQALFEQYRDQALILLTPHLGAWEFTGLYVGSQRRLTGLYKPPKLKNLENLLKQARQRSGAQLVPTTPLGIRQLFKALKNQEAIGILPDQEPRLGSGEFAPFMQQSAYTMTLIHRLVQKTKAKVLLTYAERLPNAQGFKIVYQAPPPAIYAADQAQALRALNQAIENCLSTCPAQYQWTYKRFKRRPQNLPSIYD